MRDDSDLRRALVPFRSRDQTAQVDCNNSRMTLASREWRGSNRSGDPKPTEINRSISSDLQVNHN